MSEEALALYHQQGVDVPTVRVSALLAARLASKSERTRAAYQRDYESFRDFVGASSVDEALIKLVSSPGDVAMTVVLAFQAELSERGMAPATINRRLSALRAAVQIAKEAQLTQVDLKVDLLDPEEEARDVRGPGMEAIRAMVAACDGDDSLVGVRDGALLRWMVMTGLRRNELRELMMRHVALEGQTGLRVKQKGKRLLHLVPVDPAILHTADRWLELRTDARGAFYCSLDRSRVTARAKLDPSTLNRIVRKRAEQAGFEGGKLPDGRPITPHGFRHTAITQVIKRFGLAAAQAFARHAHPSTTQRYNDEKQAMNLEAQAFMLGEL